MFILTTCRSLPRRLRVNQKSSTINYQPVQLSTLKLSCSLFLCLLAHVSFGQEDKKKADSLHAKFYPRSFRLGTDVIALAKTQTMATFTGWEMNGDVDFGKYYFAIDYGSWGKDKTLPDSGYYHNSGTYWRVGWDVNLLKKDPDRNMFFIGFRYAQSHFNESTAFNYKDAYFGDIQKHLVNPTMTAGWGEMTAGLRVKIWKQFWMGYTARMKFALSVKGDTEFTPYDIPGYGINGKGFYWGFNYQIFWRIPFKKEIKPVVSLLK